MNFSTNFGYIPKPSDVKKYTIDNINYGSIKNKNKEKTN
jgi:hypothetical protein